MSQTTATAQPISPLRRRMIEDMTVRGFGEKTQSDYIRHVKNFSLFLGRSPHTATPEDLRTFQVHQSAAGVQPPTMNSTVSALRFFFTTTLDRPEMARLQANGMVRPCSCPASERRWTGAASTGARPCPRQQAPRSP